MSLGGTNSLFYQYFFFFHFLQDRFCRTTKWFYVPFSWSHHRDSSNHLEISSKLKMLIWTFARISFTFTWFRMCFKVCIQFFFYFNWRFHWLFQMFFFFFNFSNWHQTYRALGFNGQFCWNELQEDCNFEEEIPAFEGESTFFLNWKFSFLFSLMVCVTKFLNLISILQIFLGFQHSPAEYLKISSQRESRHQFVTTALDFILRFDFDGLDLIWSYEKWVV